MRRPPPLRAIGHFGYFLGPKVHRALIGLEDVGDVDADYDANGSAKAAPLALDELESSLVTLAEAAVLDDVDTARLLREAASLRDDLERLFPRARAFVRPGFDEPSAVALLEWQERGNRRPASVQ
ncbi:MAG: hypothetical protein R2712_27060 [Vicinamibacterales bacterium]